MAKNFRDLVNANLSPEQQAEARAEAQAMLAQDPRTSDAARAFATDLIKRIFEPEEGRQFTQDEARLVGAIAFDSGYIDGAEAVLKRIVTKLRERGIEPDHEFMRFLGDDAIRH